MTSTAVWSPRDDASKANTSVLCRRYSIICSNQRPIHRYWILYRLGVEHLDDVEGPSPSRQYCVVTLMPMIVTLLVIGGTP